MENPQINVNTMLESMSKRIAELEKEKAVMTAQIEVLQQQLQSSNESEQGG